MSGERSVISGLALSQLAPYQMAAYDWPRYPDGRAVRCGKCDQSMYFTEDANEVKYVYTDEEKLALIVAHIRQVHPEAVDGT